MFGIGRQQPHHDREMLKIVRENRDELPAERRILNGLYGSFFSSRQKTRRR